MKRILLTIAYDGTAYSGFQAQKDETIPTIAGVVTQKLCELTGEEITLIGGSRTDAGVHALCNKTAFDTQSRIPAQKVAFALNTRLPEDIRVRESEEVPEDFHPLHVPSRKTYEYRILIGTHQIPQKRLYSAYIRYPLDKERMREGASYLVGEHDFKSFCSIYTQARSTVRTIWGIEIDGAAVPYTDDEEVIIRVTGGGFLYNMVRIIAGTLIDVGRGKMEPEKVKEILEGLDRHKAGPTAPACGLTLVKYEFV